MSQDHKEHTTSRKWN